MANFLAPTVNYETVLYCNCKEHLPPFLKYCFWSAVVESSAITRLRYKDFGISSFVAGRTARRLRCACVCACVRVSVSVCVCVCVVVCKHT